jgi:hypothetical protein
MDADRNGSREAYIAAYAFALLFLSMLGLMAASEANHRPGNPYVAMAALTVDE